MAMSPRLVYAFMTVLLLLCFVGVFARVPLDSRLIYFTSLSNLYELMEFFFFNIILSFRLHNFFRFFFFFWVLELCYILGIGKNGNWEQNVLLDYVFFHFHDLDFAYFLHYLTSVEDAINGVLFELWKLYFFNSDSSTPIY